MTQHRELYPEQYTHPLVGRRVEVRDGGRVLAHGVVARVFDTRYGQLVELEGQAGRAWLPARCHVVDPKGGTI